MPEGMPWSVSGISSWTAQSLRARAASSGTETSSNAMSSHSARASRTVCAPANWSFFSMIWLQALGSWPKRSAHTKVVKPSSPSGLSR